MVVCKTACYFYKNHYNSRLHGGSPRMVILSNGSGAEASSPLKSVSAGGRARRLI